MERSPRGRTTTPNAPNEVPADACHAAEGAEALREDDICALCGQAWVTQQEVKTFLSLKAREQLQRTPLAAPVVSPAAPQRYSTPSRTGSAVKRGASRGHNSTESLLSLVGGSAANAKATAPPASAHKAPPIAPAAPVATSAEMVNMMILCDGCDGSYHMICIGKTRSTTGYFTSFDTFLPF